jgi:MFS family permease
MPDAAAHGWFHPTRRPYRFTLLFFVSLLIYGSYFAYDSVGAIEDSLMKTLHIGQEEIGTMYSMYSLAAILTLFAAGMLIDRIGTRKASMIFSALVTLGAIIVALAPDVWLLYVGRFIFGAGSEALIVSQSAILARWFKGRELAFSFGVALAISRIGTLFTFNTEALIAEKEGPYAALWVAAGLCVASLLANVVYVVMDKRAEPLLGLKEEGGGDKIVFSDVRKLPASFWYVSLLCMTFYSAIFPFTALSTNFFHEKWGLPLTAGSGGGFWADVFDNFLHMFSTAPGTTSIIIFASMIFAPFAGNMVDRIGRRASLMILGSLLLIPSHLVMGYSTIPPIFPMIVLGAAFVLVPAAMWPSVPLVVDKRFVGTAFGLMTLIQNFGLMAFPWLNGKLREATHNYEASMLMFASLGIVGLVFAFLLKRSDARHGSVLERPEVKAQA